MIQPQGDQCVSRSEFASIVESDAILEVVIIKRQEIILRNHKVKATCPRCNHVNPDYVTNNGWIDWQVPLNCGIYFNSSSPIVVVGVTGCFKQFWMQLLEIRAKLMMPSMMRKKIVMRMIKSIAETTAKFMIGKLFYLRCMSFEFLLTTPLITNRSSQPKGINTRQTADNVGQKLDNAGRRADNMRSRAGNRNLHRIPDYDMKYFRRICMVCTLLFYLSLSNQSSHSTMIVLACRLASAIFY